MAQRQTNVIHISVRKVLTVAKGDKEKDEIPYRSRINFAASNHQRARLVQRNQIFQKLNTHNSVNQHDRKSMLKIYKSQQLDPTKTHVKIHAVKKQPFDFHSNNSIEKTNGSHIFMEPLRCSTSLSQTIDDSRCYYHTKHIATDNTNERHLRILSKCSIFHSNHVQNKNKGISQQRNRHEEKNEIQISSMSSYKRT